MIKIAVDAMGGDGSPSPTPINPDGTKMSEEEFDELLESLENSNGEGTDGDSGQSTNPKGVDGKGKPIELTKNTSKTLKYLRMLGAKSLKTNIRIPTTAKLAKINFLSVIGL